VIEGKNEGGKPMGVGAKVKELTWRRLMANEAIIHRWQEVRFQGTPYFVALLLLTFFLGISALGLPP
jgi:hypothetical protein